MFNKDELFEIRGALHDRLDYFMNLEKNVAENFNDIEDKQTRMNRWHKRVNETQKLLDKVEKLIGKL